MLIQRNISDDEIEYVLSDIRPISGSGPVPLVDGNTVEITAGFVSFWRYYNEEIHGNNSRNQLKTMEISLRKGNKTWSTVVYDG